MKQLIAIALPILLLTACNSTEKHRAGIEALSAQWDEATTSVTDFAGTLQAEQASFQQNVASMQVSDEVLAKVKDASKKDAVMQAYTSLQGAGTAFGSISAEVANFVTTWTEKAAEVNALKEGLANGKLEGDVPAKIAELSAVATDAQAKVATWNEQLNATKSAIASQQASYQTLAAEFMPQN